MKTVRCVIRGLSFTPNRHCQFEGCRCTFQQRCGATRKNWTYADEFTSHNPLVPKMCSTDPKGSATSTEGIRGYISVMPTLKFADFFVN